MEVTDPVHLLRHLGIKELPLLLWLIVVRFTPNFSATVGLRGRGSC